MQPETVITLNLPMQQVGIVIQALGEIPAKYSLAAIEEIQRQVSAQVTIPDPTPPAPPTED